MDLWLLKLKRKKLFLCTREEISGEEITFSLSFSDFLGKRTG